MSVMREYADTLAKIENASASVAEPLDAEDVRYEAELDAIEARFVEAQQLETTVAETGAGILEEARAALSGVGAQADLTVPQGMPVGDRFGVELDRARAAVEAIRAASGELAELREGRRKQRIRDNEARARELAQQRALELEEEDRLRRLQAKNTMRAAIIAVVLLPVGLVAGAAMKSPIALVVGVTVSAAAGAGSWFAGRPRG